MGTWGHGNFDGDSELDYLGTLADGIVQEIEEHAASRGLDIHSFLNEIMPRIAVLDALVTHCNSSIAPDRQTLIGWRRKFLELFDDQAESLGDIDDFVKPRRQAIEATFQSLINACGPD